MKCRHRGSTGQSFSNAFTPIWERSENKLGSLKFIFQDLSSVLWQSCGSPLKCNHAHYTSGYTLPLASQSFGCIVLANPTDVWLTQWNTWRSYSGLGREQKLGTMVQRNNWKEMLVIRWVLWLLLCSLSRDVEQHRASSFQGKMRPELRDRLRCLRIWDKC